MSNIVNIQIQNRQLGDELIKTCDGREIHAELGVSKDYTTWAKAQIKRARLVENRDYLLTQQGEQLPSGMKWKSVYHFTLEAAKHIGMMSGTDRGHEVREYFIACERIAKEAGALEQTTNMAAALGNPEVLRQTLLVYTEKVIVLEDKVADLAPKAAALEQITASKESLTITQAAKVLGIKLDELTTFMHEKGWVYRQNKSWVAYAKHIHSGDLKYKEARYTDEKTEMGVLRPYCHITPKGLTTLARLLSCALETA